MTALEQAVIRTVAYFDMFEYPLTHWEVYLFLYSEDRKRCTLLDIEQTLEESVLLKKKLFFQDGFVGFAGKEKTIATRQRRYVGSHHKYHIVKRFVRLAKAVPFIDLIASCNNLAFSNAKKESDLDFFIVAKKGALPFVRLSLVLLSMVFFSRPQENSHEDTICLSFIIDTGHDELDSMARKEGDIYLTYWYATLIPLYVRDEASYYALEKSNAALLSRLPHHLPRTSTVLTITGTDSIRRLFEMMWTLLRLDALHSILYSLQVKRLPKEIVDTMNNSSSVIVTPSIFKTHIHDKREHIHEAWLTNSR